MLTGTGTNAVIEVLLNAMPVSRIDFGKIAVGEGSIKRVAVKNAGGGSGFRITGISVGGTDADAFAVVSNECNGVLLRSGSLCYVDLEFKSSDPGVKEGVLNIQTDVGITRTITLRGDVVAKSVNVSPESYNFGAVRVGETKSFQWSVSGSTTFYVESIKVSHPTLFVLTKDFCSRRYVSAGSSCNFEITFMPNDAGGFSGSVTVTAEIGGDTIQREINVLGSGLSDVQPLTGSIGGTVSFVVDFGSVAVYQQSEVKSVEVINLADSSIHIDSVVKSGYHPSEFSIVGDTCSGIDLAPGQRCKVDLVFTPKQVFKREAVLGIAPRYYAPLNFSLVGVGTDGIPEIRPSSQNLDINVAVDPKVRYGSFTVTNIGNLQISISNVAIVGNSAFSIFSNGCNGAVLPPRGICEITVKFSPPETGKYSATLKVDTSSTLRPSVSAQIYGVGYKYARVQFDVGSNTQVVRGHWSEWVPVTIRSIGDSPLQIVNLGFSNELCNLDYGTCGGSSFILDVGESCQINVRCFASGIHGVGGVLTGSTNAINSRFPDVQFSVLFPQMRGNEVRMGYVPKNEVRTGDVHIENTGNYPYTVESVEMLSNENIVGLFQIVSNGCTGRVIQPRGSCTIKIAFMTERDVFATAWLKVTGKSYGSFVDVLNPRDEREEYTYWLNLALSAHSTSEPVPPPKFLSPPPPPPPSPSSTYCYVYDCRIRASIKMERDKDGRCPVTEEQVCTSSGGRWVDSRCICPLPTRGEECITEGCCGKGYIGIETKNGCSITPQWACAESGGIWDSNANSCSCPPCSETVNPPLVSPIDFGNVCIHTTSDIKVGVITNVDPNHVLTNLREKMPDGRVVIPITKIDYYFSNALLIPESFLSEYSPWIIASFDYLGTTCPEVLSPGQSCEVYWRIKPRDIMRWPNTKNPFGVGRTVLTETTLTDGSVYHVSRGAPAKVFVLFGDVRILRDPHEDIRSFDFWPKRSDYKVGYVNARWEWDRGEHDLLIRTFTDKSYDFGNVLVGSVVEKTFYLRNLGSAKVTIGKIVPTFLSYSFSIASDYCSETELPPDGICSFKVVVSPRYPGFVNESFSITWSDCSGSYNGKLSVSAVGKVLRLGITPDRYNFPETLVKSIGDEIEGYSYPRYTFRAFVYKEQQDTIGNVEGITIPITGMFVNPGVFSIVEDNCSGKRLSVDESCTFTVEFVPTSEANYTGYVAVASGDPIAPVQTVHLTGKGVAPEFYPLAPVVRFPNIPVGSTSAPFKVVVKNIGDYPLKIYAVDLTDPANFGIVEDTCFGANIPPNGTCYVSVVFHPTIASAINALLLFYTNDPDHGASPVYLEGNVGVAAENGCYLMVQPDVLDFGKVRLGQRSNPSTLIVGAVCESPTGYLPITSMGLTNMVDFEVVSSTCGTRIESGTFCEVNIVFQPSPTHWSSVRTGYFNVSAGTLQGSAALIGEVAFPSIAVEGNTSFQGVYNGEDVVHTFTVRNTGDDGLIVTGVTLNDTTYFRVIENRCNDVELVSDETCNFSVVMDVKKVQQYGRVSAILKVMSNDPFNSVVSLDLTGSVGVPDINIRPLSLVVECEPGKFCYGRFYISNDGEGILNVSSITLSGIQRARVYEDQEEPVEEENLSLVSTPVELYGGGHTKAVIVGMKPESYGVYKGKIVVRSNDPDEPEIRAEIIFNVIEPDILVFPRSIDFGDVLIGSKRISTILISNQGGGVISGSYRYSGPNAFTLSGETPFSIGSGEMTSVTVKFAPTSVGSYQGKVTVLSNDGDEPSIDVVIKGNGVAELSGLKIVPREVDFGTVRVGEMSLPVDFEVFNYSPSEVSIAWDRAGIGSGSPFVIEGDLPDVLGPNASFKGRIYFAPTEDGVYTGSIKVYDVNNPSNSDTLNVKGKTEGGSPIISVSPEEIDFGIVRPSETSPPRTVTVSNVGSGGLEVSSIISDNPSVFNVVNNTCIGKSLGFGERCTFDIVYASSALGKKNGAIKVKSNAVSGRDFVMVSGETADATAEISPTMINFGLVPRGALSSSYFVTVTNLGPGRLWIRSTEISTEGTSASFFIGYNTCFGWLEEGRKCVIEVYSKPARRQEIKGSLVVNTLSVITPTLSVGLKVNGTQAVNCPEGMVYSVELGKCVAAPSAECPAGQTYSAYYQKCVAPVEVGCESGFINIGGICQQVRHCPEGTLLMVNPDGSQTCYAYVGEPECPEGFMKMTLSDGSILCYANVVELGN
ncbi:MAG: choice-of-anchor D domain-containing protein [Nitrososphaerota archaeon]